MTPPEIQVWLKAMFDVRYHIIAGFHGLPCLLGNVIIYSYNTEFASDKRGVKKDEPNPLEGK